MACTFLVSERFRRPVLVPPERSDRSRRIVRDRFGESVHAPVPPVAARV